MTNKNISTIVRHYCDTVPNFQSHLDDLIESINTGVSNSRVLIEDYGNLGKGYFVKGHGSYIANGSHVLFMKEIK